MNISLKFKATMRPINQCLNTNLNNICRKAIQLEALNDIVQNYLPCHIKEHCHVGSFTNGCLKLVVDNSSWSTELRYLLPELRDTLRTEAKLYQLSSIKTVFSLPDEPIQSKPKKSMGLSANAQQSIIQEAKQLENGALKEALLKLAK